MYPIGKEVKLVIIANSRDKRPMMTLNPKRKMKKNTFKILFHIRGNYKNKEGKCPITIRIAVNGEYERINSTVAVEPELWDVKAMKAIGRSAKILEINKRL